MQWRCQLIVLGYHTRVLRGCRGGMGWESPRGGVQGQSPAYEVWIGLSSVLRPRQHSIGYMGDGFYRSKDPTNSIKVLKKEEATKKNLEKLNNKIHTQIRNSTR